MTDLLNAVGRGLLAALAAIYSTIRQHLAANMWRAMTVAAIVFSAGISGAWLSEQMHRPLPLWWGWFGAALAGFAVYGGVTLVLDGERVGWLILLVGASAEIALSAAYFGVGHSGPLALTLGVYPSGIAVLSGVVESRRARHQQRQQDDADRRAHQRQREAEEREWQWQQKALDRQAERDRQAKRDQLNTQLALERERTRQLNGPGQVYGRLNAPAERPVQPNGQLAGQPNDNRSVAELKAELLNIVRQNPTVSYSAIAAALGRSKASVTTYVQQLTDEGRLTRSDGVWEVA